MASNRSVTSRDVARLAGVSQSAVSLVLGGKSQGRVSAPRAQAIRAAAAELGYRPNAAARALRTGSAQAVGLAVADVTQPFFSHVLAGAQSEAAKRATAVMLIDAAHGSAESYEVLRAAGAIDGLLWFAGSPPQSVRRHGPTVVMETEDARLPSVSFAVDDGFRALGQHLRALGHTRVAHLRARQREDMRDGSGITELTFELRAWGLARGLGLAPAPVVPCAVTVAAGRAAAHTALDSQDPPTAIVGDDDLIAAGAYLAARERGLRVPDDISIAGMDDLEIGRVLDPPLTTVRLDARRLGAVAFEALASEMRGEPAPGRQRLAVEFIPRGSTGPRP